MSKSPFPGMDPYLEQFWGDVHTSLMTYMRDQINEQLPGDLQARVEESLKVDWETESRTIYPDVSISEAPYRPYSPSQVETGATAIAEPTIVALPNELRTERHIQIIDRNSGNSVVTAIELLSPANKCSKKGREEYQHKQSQYFEAGVNLVEIDLIRNGEFVLAIPKNMVPKALRSSPYLICIRRATRSRDAEPIRVPLREPLPNFAIPLRPSDQDIVVQLQPLLDDCYRRGRYATLDYKAQLTPPLSLDDQEWATEQIRQRETMAATSSNDNGRGTS